MPPLLVLMLELFVLRHVTDEPALSFFAGWILCLIYASLRFDDGLHVRPDSLSFKGGVLYGLCWQTKVERHRRGSRFAVPETGYSFQEGHTSWFQAFMEVSEIVPNLDRDF